MPDGNKVAPIGKIKQSKSLFDKKYSYVKELGAGGFGKVFLAKERVLYRLVVNKQLLKTNKHE